MRSCIMPGLPTHLVQELNVGTVAGKMSRPSLTSMSIMPDIRNIRNNSTSQQLKFIPISLWRPSTSPFLSRILHFLSLSLSLQHLGHVTRTNKKITNEKCFPFNSNSQWANVVVANNNFQSSIVILYCCVKSIVEVILGRYWLINLFNAEGTEAQSTRTRAKNFENHLNPVMLVWIALAEHCQMSTHVSGFQPSSMVFHHFVLDKLSTSSISVQHINISLLNICTNVLGNLLYRAHAI